MVAQGALAAPGPAEPVTKDGPLAGAGQSVRGPVHRTGAGRRPRRSARVPAAKCKKSRTRRSAPGRRAGAAILTGPLLIFGPAISGTLLIVVITERRRR